MFPLKKIILVDDCLVNLTVGVSVLKHNYQVSTASSGKELFTALASGVRPDLILLDIQMPEMDGFEVLKRLKADSRTAEIPVIFLTANNSLKEEAKAFGLGAADFILKPFYPSFLLKRLELHLQAESQAKTILDYEMKIAALVQNNKAAMGDLQNRLLKTVIELVERRDEVGDGHVERTRKYVEVLLDVLIKNNVYHDVISSWEKDLFLQSTLLYDLGKISIKDDILRKPGKLAENEFNEMKKHTLMGVKIIEEIQTDLDENSTAASVLGYGKVLAGFHHEKWDGSGYPYGLKGYNIPLPGRLMAIADVYDALIARRPYKKSYTHEEATNIISQGKGTHFDPVLVDLFVSVADKFRLIVKETASPSS
ncbi:MAG: response regulator [Treponema sp.]|jgi:putative two-component system response regulator|nr:response regulator [Treponema sp.]